MKSIVAATLCVALAGCAHAPTVVMGHCEIPAALDHEAHGPADLTPLPYEQALGAWAGERAGYAQLADDYNALRNHVRAKCN